ncbi:MAG: FxsA family protein [Kordiimonadaceae bacterium]|jgi:UPF0716 protein FxsA|nr:FxsA family protein [Kordiimonadaceae bacterium]MBT6033315.1 FxsA family protein [Kordiimonadaceae bacterium]
MPLIILVVIITVPYLEFLVFMEVGNEIGGFSALMLTILTAFLGIYIIRQEGIQVLIRLKNTIDKGESPVSELIHGFFLAVAGFFFLLPGFITDGIALLLAIAPIRSMLGSMIVNAGIRQHANRPRSTFSEGTIIDGEFEESNSINPEEEQQISNDHHDDPKK